jgi:hypothetical protein
VVRLSFSVLAVLATSSGIGACAALSGLDHYETADCATSCSADDGGTGDATVGADASRRPDAGGRGDGAGSLDATEPEENKTPEAGEGDGGRASDGSPADGEVEAGNDGGLDAGDGGDASDASTLDAGLVAYYEFDETSGTTAADSSGNGHTATMSGATFTAGLQGNAATMNGSNRYVSLPNGIVNGLTSFSISTWVVLNSAQAWVRIFDFGTGTNTYMFLTPNETTGKLRFAITTSGSATGNEERLDGPTLPTGSWQHVAVTLTGSTATLYVNGAQAAQNTAITLNPTSLGNTTQDWLGRSEFAVDPYYNGEIDDFRIYSRALSAAEVQALYANHL